jgi:hypothetical protein
MANLEKHRCIARLRKKYAAANRKEKTKILDSVCLAFACHRKEAIRALNPSNTPRPAKKKGRPPVYQKDALLRTLKKIYLLADQPCSKRFVALIPLWLPAVEKREPLPPEIRAALLAMSAATIDRLLAPTRAKKKGARPSKPGSLLRNSIPIRTGSDDINRPGFAEIDTVAHCGNSLLGDFVWSLTLTDIHSQWTEMRAVWNKGAHGVLEKIDAIRQILPFALIALDSDNGSEFINNHLVRYCAIPENPVLLTRSRPYRKNDQAHVEQKNWTHVRQVFGYDRLDCAEYVARMDAIYQTLGFLNNYFVPVMKLVSKQRENAKIRKTYDAPKTPCQRLLDSPDIPETTKVFLRAQMAELDPLALRDQLQNQLRTFWKFVRDKA